MQTCSRCHSLVADTIDQCPVCQGSLEELSEAKLALTRLRANPRILSIRISVAPDACPECQKIQGNYEKDNVPALPVEGCSHEHGCRCFYDPVLGEIYP
ncbi:MAG: hypothetical protein HPY45_06180 [Anaerolineae bacterium]|nr:hypothetical protein [Anaerolineae bacterium]